MAWLLVVLATVPLAAALACLAAPHRTAGLITVVAGMCSLAASVALVPAAGGPRVLSLGFLRLDAISEVFLLPTGLLYAMAAVYSIGYLAEDARRATEGGHEEAATFRRYSKLFHVGLNLFAWSMLCAPLGDGLAVLWIAVEVTTVVSALLVALDDTAGATEAAWKYVLIASCGLGIALLATVVMYYAGAQRLGESYDLAFGPLVAHASQLSETPVRLAFVLAVIGFGTKVGLVPVHTWLPDAHAEAPTPVSALLSGSLLAVSFYAILRYYQVAHLTLGDRFPQAVLLVFGAASLLVAALSLLAQRGLKRLLAYSSVEHMGILAIGVGFGARTALVGVLLHVLAHAAAKGNAFLGAGVVVRRFQTKSIGDVDAGLDRMPWTGPLFLASILALCALPPSGLFRSEFLIAAGGVEDGRHMLVVVLLVLVTVAFLGLVEPAAAMMMSPADSRSRGSGAGDGIRASRAAGGPDPATGRALAVVDRPEVTRARVTEPVHYWWFAGPMVAGLVVVAVLGIHPPADLDQLLHAAADQLIGAPR